MGGGAVLPAAVGWADLFFYFFFVAAGIIGRPLQIIFLEAQP